VSALQTGANPQDGNPLCVAGARSGGLPPPVAWCRFRLGARAAHKPVYDSARHSVTRDGSATAAPAPQPNGESNPVGGTNNEAERTLRGAAQARATGRTNKTLQGARRQTILTSVLESLRLYLKTFTLASVLEELKRWWKTGQSCFTTLLKRLNLSVSDRLIINQILPNPTPSG